MALPERECARPGCGVWFAPRRSDAKYHDEACRKAAARDRAKADAVEVKVSEAAAEEAGRPEREYRALSAGFMEATRRELVAAGVADSASGQGVMLLAHRIDNAFGESGPSLATLIKQHREALQAAVASGKDRPSATATARAANQQARFRLAAAS